MVELVDTRDLKSLGHRLCRFKPGSGYQKKKPSQTCLRRLFLFLKPPIHRRDKPAAGRGSRAGPAVSSGGSSRPERGPASIRDGLENALHPAGAAMQMQDAGKAVLHLQYGLVPQGQRGAT